MRNLLVIFKKNWADECDVHGWMIMNQAKFDDLLASLPKLTYYFGTNQGWEEPGEFDGHDFTAVPITAGEEDFLRTTFKPYDDIWGNFPDWRDALWNQLWELRDSLEEDASAGRAVSSTEIAEARAIVKSFDPATQLADNDFVTNLIRWMDEH
jgi:hypothetical protein